MKNTVKNTPMDDLWLTLPTRAASEDDGDGKVKVLTRPEAKTKRPSMYKVVMLNDDYTPMEFVIHVLELFFGMSRSQAHAIMMTVHVQGVAVVGVFTYEVAEAKVAQVMDYAQRNEHPLQCRMEKE